MFGVLFVHFATVAFKMKRKKNLGSVSQFIYFYTFDLCLLGVSAWGVSKILKNCHFFDCLLGVSAQKFSVTVGKPLEVGQSEGHSSLGSSSAKCNF